MFTYIELALSAGVLITLVSTLAACVCGCKNSNQKSELVGTAGVVKICFDEEAPSPTPTTPASVKRASAQNSNRSLPEIPHPVARHDSGDTASELYATVNLDEGDKQTGAPSTDRDHPYEHAYAKLHNDTLDITVEIPPDQRSEGESEIEHREAGHSTAESVVISASVAISGQLPSSQELPYITPPSPRPDTDAAAAAAAAALHFSGDSTDSAKGYTSISVREPLSNIRAQSMKPPSQPHYATVSDDSDEMYAAIEEASVGEGSDTYAQIAADVPQPAPAPAPAPIHAATASARRSAPPDVGASASASAATHSRQGQADGGDAFTEPPASSSSCTNSTGALGSPKPEKRQANSPLPPPPAPPPAHHPPPRGEPPPRHQRMSSTGDLFNHDKLRRSLNEKHQRNNSCVSSSDFYGCNYPVEKHRFSSGDIIRPLVARELNFDIDRDNNADNLYNSIDGAGCGDYSSAEPNARLNSERVNESPSRNLEEMYAKVMKKAKVRTDELSRRSKDTNEEGPKFRPHDPGYETIHRKKSNHGYETIARKQRQNSQSQDPGYETVKEINKMNHNPPLKANHFNAESGPGSIVSSDAGYEHIAKPDNSASASASASASDSEPNYEVLRNNPPTPPYATIAPAPAPAPAYSTVHKRADEYWQQQGNGDHLLLEPNYESMPNEGGYNTGSESDPNYESVGAQEPNYESLRCRDPDYESVRPSGKQHKYHSVSSHNDPNYETVKYLDVARKEPPYEKVPHDDNLAPVRVARSGSDSSAGYLHINVPPPPRHATTTINGAHVVSDYFQV